MVIPPALPALPAHVTPFRASWPVRFGDTDVNEVLLLDAVARYLQDIGFENIEASEDADTHRIWVVRRNVIDVLRPIRFGERVDMMRWCAATSNRWSNMRVRINGTDGGLVETESFVIHFNETTGMPARMSDRFLAPLLAMTDEHRLRWKSALTEPLPAREEADAVLDFPLRVTDIDRMNHVNNTVYFSGLEEALARHADIATAPYRAILEYTKPLTAGEKVELVTKRDGNAIDVWFAVADEARAVARVQRL